MMWNYYNDGDLTNCCNIHIEPDTIVNNYREKSIELNFENVIYDEKKKIENLCRIIKLIYEIKDQDPYLEKTKYLIEIVLENLQFKYKNESYSDEEEIRAIYYVAKEEGSDIGIKYRTAHGMMIPYIIMGLDLEQISGVSLGPRNCNDKSVETMQEYLQSVGISATVKKSNIPIRF